MKDARRHNNYCGPLTGFVAKYGRGRIVIQYRLSTSGVSIREALRVLCSCISFVLWIWNGV